jgi:hypothetical protein
LEQSDKDKSHGPSYVDHRSLQGRRSTTPLSVVRCLWRSLSRPSVSCSWCLRSSFQLEHHLRVPEGFMEQPHQRLVRMCSSVLLLQPRRILTNAR